MGARDGILALALCAAVALTGFAPQPAPAGAALMAAASWDAGKAHQQCQDFTTYGMAEDGVYGPWFQAMYQFYGWTDCKRTDNDLGSSEVIAAFQAEKNNPKGVIADIGIAFGPQAATEQLTLKYTPQGSGFVPTEYREEGGGWIGSVVGAVGFAVNEEAVPNPPHSWADLL